MSKKYHYQSSNWINKSYKRCLRYNYSWLDVLLGLWRYKASKNHLIRDSYFNLSQRHQIRSRFL